MSWGVIVSRTTMIAMRNEQLMMMRQTQTSFVYSGFGALPHSDALDIHAADTLFTSFTCDEKSNIHLH